MHTLSEMSMDEEQQLECDQNKNVASIVLTILGYVSETAFPIFGG